MGSCIQFGAVSREGQFTAIHLLGLQRWGSDGSDKAMEGLLREHFGLCGILNGSEGSKEGCRLLDS